MWRHCSLDPNLKKFTVRPCRAVCVTCAPVPVTCGWWGIAIRQAFIPAPHTVTHRSSFSVVFCTCTTATPILQITYICYVIHTYKLTHVVLSNAQVAVILQVSAGAAVHRDETLNEVYRKTQKYVNRFNTMSNNEKDQQEVVNELDNLQELSC